MLLETFVGASGTFPVKTDSVRRGIGNNHSAALPVSAAVAILNIGSHFMLAVFNAAGQIGNTRVLAGRARGKLCDTPEGYR
jgi:hypothetical protein